MRTQEEKITFIENFKKRIKSWVLRVIQFCKKLPNTNATRVINFQLVKSDTSTGANHRASYRARSNNEFYAKICIAVEESDESLYWLELLRDSQIRCNEKELSWLINESEEILKILVSAKFNAKKG